jgi:serine/threonine-protein kinase
MQPPIPLGTILQNRYRLIKILGQGGMARTYLAEDQGRFNEFCALKELILAQTENYLLEKSRQLFQREATILYRIHHPQIPQFRATFEQDQRLFLVQDYVEGKTYRTLLDERKAAGKTFTQAEVLQLLRLLLPVLAHLHARGIIHRDITPDNIILREGDAKPVLIDFGVVKELANRLQSANNTSQATTVGKWGYAPSEQIQTGRAYPSSDLYALAVTAVVLLTGREPQELFDETLLMWNWQRWVTVSPEFARVLNRMLSYQPGDRYQSVAEVAQALQALNNQTNHGSLAAESSKQPLPPQLPRQQASSESSQIQTVAVGRHPNLIQPSTSKPERPNPVIPAPTNREIWENPGAIFVIGTGVALFSGIGSWTLVSSILANQRPAPQTFPSPIISATPTPTPTTSNTRIPSTEPVNHYQRLNIATGEAASVESTLKANETINYTFSGEQGQQLSATLAEEGVLLTVLGPNQEPVDDTERVTRYRGTLPLTGDYVIRLSPVREVGESNYKLNLLLENPVAPTSTPTPTPTFDVQTINFNPGETATQISGQTKPQQIKRYLLNAQEGQLVSVAVEQGSVTLDIRYPDGQLVENASKLLNWQAQVPRSGEYQIDVIPIQDQDTDFTLDVSARNLDDND